MSGDWIAVLVMASITLILFGLTAYLKRETSRVTQENKRRHAAATAHIAYVVSNEFAAEVLSQAARDWDTADTRRELRVLAEATERTIAPSLPAMWLMQRAEALRSDAVWARTRAEAEDF